MAISALHALTQAERDQSQPRPANDNRKPNAQDTNLQEHAAEESGNDRKTCRKRDPCRPRKLVTPQAEDRVEAANSKAQEHLQILKEIIPGTSRVAVLGNPDINARSTSIT
jgi:hypothetical protein